MSFTTLATTEATSLCEMHPALNVEQIYVWIFTFIHAIPSNTKAFASLLKNSFQHGIKTDQVIFFIWSDNKSQCQLASPR